MQLGETKTRQLKEFWVAHVYRKILNITFLCSFDLITAQHVFFKQTDFLHYNYSN